MRFHDEKSGLYYEKYEDYIAISDCDKKSDTIVVPEFIEELPVKRIVKKAFLGHKLLRELVIPDGISDIGDFAFALCDKLSMVSLPAGINKLGKNLFKNDLLLKSICIRRDDINEDIAALMAAAPVTMDAEYLIDVSKVSGTEWLNMWDMKFADILRRADDEGYHLYVLCGEEDLHFDHDQYVEYIREKKAGLCMLRLMHKDGLSDDMREKAIEYLKEFTNPPINISAFHYYIKNHGEDINYLQLLLDNDIITNMNRECLIGLMGDRFPEAKSVLISSAGNNSGGDFFAGLEL